MKLKISHYMHNNSNMSMILEKEESIHYYFISKTYRISKYKRFYNEKLECISLYKNAGIYFDHFTFIYAI